MSMTHKGCGGEFEIRGWTDYGPEYGKLPDFYCKKCGEFLAGDAQIKEDSDDWFAANSNPA